MKAQISAETVITRLGGTTATAELCEVTPGAVSQWKKRKKGIPKHQIKFLMAVRPEVFEDRRKNNGIPSTGRRSKDKKSP